MYFSNTLAPLIQPPPNEPSLFSVYVTLCDALVDDDDDVRENAAKTASTILSSYPLKVKPISPGQEISLMPSAALEGLFAFLATQYKNSSHFFIEGISRMTKATGSETDNDVDSLIDTHHSGARERTKLLPSVGEMLNLAMRPDTSLFAEEKQNLFVDDVQEAQRWARALQKLQADSMDAGAISELEIWVQEGLEALIEIVRKEAGGVLGWSSIPDVFTIGMRVFLAAEVLLEWTAKRYCQVDSAGIRGSLDWLGKIEVGELHPVWQDHILRIQTTGTTISNSID